MTYPDRLRADAIPPAARALAVADAYDAMRSRRSYRAPMPPDAIRAELLRGRGMQWDPEFVDALLSVIDACAVRLRPPPGDACDA